MTLLSKLTKNRYTLFVFLAIFAVIGTVLLVSSRAASPYSQISADSGTISGNASLVHACAGSSAPSGNCVEFGGNNLGMMLTLSGNKISWPSQTGATSYSGAISNGPRSNTSRTTTYHSLGNVTSWTPPSDCGNTDYYGVQPNNGPWSTNEVSITWPGCGGGGTPVTLSSPPTEQTALLSGGTIGLKLNEWNSSLATKMTSDGGSDFNIASSSLNLPTGGAPSGYWELWKGSSWGAKTTGGSFPYLVSNINKTGIVSTSATCHTSGVIGDWDNSYDIWFNADPNADTKPGGNQGGTHLEMMVWLNHTAGAQPIGSKIASSVPIGGNTYDIWYNGNGGNTISYVLSTPSTTISTDLLPLMQDSLSRGYMQKSWYLLDVEFGFEIWNGGAGLSCSNFTVNAL
ncbi:MAG: hypothetical protein ACHQT9_02170 [Candidatus Saccharimonadales bacterium]